MDAQRKYQRKAPLLPKRGARKGFPLWGKLSPQVTDEGASTGHFPLIRRVPRHLPPQGEGFSPAGWGHPALHRKTQFHSKNCRQNPAVPLFLPARLCYNLGNTAQFPPNGLSTAPSAAARHLRCQNARQYTKYCLRFWLSSCRTSLAVSALRIMRYCLYGNTKKEVTRRAAGKPQNLPQGPRAKQRPAPPCAAPAI